MRPCWRRMPRSWRAEAFRRPGATSGGGGGAGALWRRDPKDASSPWRGSHTSRLAETSFDHFAPLDTRVKKQIVVVGAVIVRDGLILCAQRGAGGALAGLWEFPGGKIEADETQRQALEREIAEELECSVEVGDEVTTTTHDYDFGIVTLTTFYCRLRAGEPRLTEHQGLRWLSPRELRTVEWAPADIPAVELLASEGAPR